MTLSPCIPKRTGRRMHPQPSNALIGLREILTMDHEVIPGLNRLTRPADSANVRAMDHGKAEAKIQNGLLREVRAMTERMIGDARELDDQRQELVAALGEWRNAEAPPEDVLDAIEAFVEAKVDHMSNFPPRQRMTDEGSLGMPTGSCPGETRGNLGANSPAQRSSLDAMVTRFLQWRLPDDFDPDCGISFKKPNHPISWPIGTNLLNADQAKAMLRYVLGAT